jgi:NAD(P)-dependent dehydrogenase (short-subunit alcohol dehydrogenase family)
MSQFNEKSTALEVIEAFKPDLTGYEIIVTGSSSGIGIETVRALAKAGARCIIAARDLDKSKSVANDITATTGNKNIEIEKLELDSLESVNQFVKRYLAKKRPLHILIKYYNF